MPGPRKLDPGIRRHLPELIDLIGRLTTGRVDKYGLLAEALDVHPSLIQQYTLTERRRRREERDAESVTNAGRIGRPGTPTP